MRTFKVKVKLKGKKIIERAILVDTGAVYSWISEKILNELGVKPKRRRRFKTITGSIVERDIGEVLMEIDREEATVPVVFAKENDAEVLGSTALEILGFEVDPIEKKLKKIEALLAL